MRVQSDFRQEAGSDTTLRRDHDYIRDCDAVVCIVGRRSGFKTFAVNYIYVLDKLGHSKTEIDATIKSIFKAAREPPA